MENSYQEKPYFLYTVWDPIVRVLHWWNAITLFSQIITGSIILIFGSEIHGGIRDNLVNIHSISGYMFAAGVFTRILWLFIGPPSAKWRDLLPLTSAQRKVFIIHLLLSGGMWPGNYRCGYT
ncbi:MAG: cytochrome b/b6 domain-containing protein [Deltaproteobacteria bacterium]|nr:cytochrome b/b6 domain-containing protein [Deltaproteobacteria bacterium]